eukprot:TRINITY_DN1748_c6_g1_i1.p1 TRINITY_DN1748_c6_g1~~TRINITY_DN1748_c6_g1_i1.p1  ORF type:complete len:500 (+),score=126.03 TRINITY_DN1748_c6_g1_i1:103-1500(+)
MADASGLALPPTAKSVWMNPVLRTWLISLRPWSLPASIVPCAVTGALLHVHSDADLYDPGYCLSLLTIVSLHAAANLFNTYFDYRTGCDTKESSSDRALVDGHVTPGTVFNSAVGLSAVGVVAGLAIMALRGSAVLWLLAGGVALTVGYSAGRASLKRLGLGDVVIFLMFGPMLFAGVSVSTIGSTPGLVLAYSVPLGLQTVAVLHGNNARDLAADKKAGVRTVAQMIGAGNMLRYHNALMVGSYACVLLLALVGPFLFSMSEDGPAGWRQVWVLLAGPWAVHLSRRYSHNHLVDMPQYIAQHNLLFGVLLCGALSKPAFAARVLLGCLFYLGGVNSILVWNYISALAHMKVTNVFPGVPERVSRLLLGVATGGQLVCSLLFMLGFETVLMARLLILFLVGVTVFVHDIWTIEDDVPAHDATASASKVAKRTIPNFPTEFDSEFVHFFKNVGMVGGLVLYVELFR